MAKVKCWVVTFMSGNSYTSHYMTATVETSNKGIDLYNEIAKVGNDWVESLGKNYPPNSAIILTLVCLGTVGHTNKGDDDECDRS